MHGGVWTVTVTWMDDPAKRQRVLDLQAHWNDPLTSIWWVLTGLGMMLVLLAGLWMYRRRRMRVLHSDPLAVFHHVARRLGLTMGQQWLLARVARAAALPTPLTLLLSRGSLEHHARQYVAALPGRRGQRAGEQLTSLAASLFEYPADGPELLLADERASMRAGSGLPIAGTDGKVYLDCRNGAQSQGGSKAIMSDR